MFKSSLFEESHIIENQDQQITRMEQNLFKIKKQMTEANQNEDEVNFDSHKSSNMSNEKIAFSIQLEYEHYLNRSQFPKDHQTKLNMLLDQQISVGSCVALYEMLFYFRDILTEDIIIQIQKKAFNKFQICQDQSEKHCFGELIAECGYADPYIVQYFTNYLLQNPGNFQLSFKILTNMGEIGLQALFQIINQDLEVYTNKMLDHLSRTEVIIQSIIIPVILHDIGNGTLKEKNTALAILNRLGQFSSHQHVMQSICHLMTQNSIDKNLLISAIRCTGQKGQQFLTQILKKQNINEEIRIIVIGALSWRPKKQLSLRIQSIQYSLSNCLLPGKLYFYEGNVQSLCFQQKQNNDNLCLNSRDFVASLQKFVNYSIQSKNYEKTNCLRQENCQNRNLFILPSIIKDQKDQEPIISQTIIQTLISLLKSNKYKLREAAVNALGIIGQPEANQCLDQIAKCLWDSESCVRSSSALALAKFEFQPSKNVINRMIQLLKDSFWKVRTSVCQSIGKIIKVQNENLVNALLKCLKDGSINRQIVCKCMINIPSGEIVLLNYLRKLHPSDFIIRQAILKSFQQIQLCSDITTSILQEIFKNSKSTRAQIRHICLVTVNSLRKISNSQQKQISYFKLKNILPFYYHFLQDSNPQIRKLASHFILDFGSHAELIFIQGITKGNINTKIESAYSLGKLGVQNFRALILGIRDMNPKVKKASCQSIIQNFTVDQVIQHYKQKENQSISLLCNLKDLVQGVQLQRQIKLFLRQTINSLQQLFYRKDLKESKIFNQDTHYLSKCEDSTEYAQNENEIIN